MTEEDQTNIREILSFTEADLQEFRRERGRHVGLRNVAMRLQLLYDREANLRVEQFRPGLIRATIWIPLVKDMNNEIQ